MHMQVDIDEHPVQVSTGKAPPLTQYYLKKALHYETLYIYIYSGNIYQIIS